MSYTPSSAAKTQRYVTRFDPYRGKRSRRRQQPQGAARESFQVPRSLHKLVTAGSSSSSGGQDGTGLTPSAFLGYDVPASSPMAHIVYAQGGAQWDQAGGTVATDAVLQVQRMVLDGHGDATLLLQADTNSYPNSGGGPETRVKQMNDKVIGTHLAGTSCLADGRYLCWVGSNPGGNLNAAIWGAQPMHDASRQTRLFWAMWPGKAVNRFRAWRRTIPRSAQDYTEQRGGQFMFSYEQNDRSHQNSRGYQFSERDLWLPLDEAGNGGLPYFPEHRYFSNRPTAQTLDGAFCTLRFFGSLDGCTLRLLGMDLAPSAYLKINNAAEVTSTGVAITAGLLDHWLEVVKGTHRRLYPIQFILGSRDKKANYEMLLDGNQIATIFSVDNAGTLTAPNFVAGTSRNLRRNGALAAGNGLKRFSIVMRLHCGLSAADDGQQLLIIGAPGFAIFRTTTNFIRVLVTDDAGATLGQITSTTASTYAAGRKWLFYSVNLDSGRQRLMLVDDATGAVNANVTSAPTNTSVNINALAYSASAPKLMALFNSTAMTQGFRGKLARMMLFPYEIDFNDVTAGPINRGLFRAGANALTDLEAVTVGNDGETFAITAGAAGSDSGNVKPMFALSGHPGDFHHGLAFGEGAGIYGDEPDNAALIGGPTFETFEVRDFFGLAANPMQGVAVLQ